jgi:GNAT superfamily N-acetyltransferase
VYEKKDISKNSFLTMSFVTRQYGEGDEKDVINLLQTVYRRWPHFDLPCTPLEHWKWKYLDNPFKHILAVVNLDDDRIIGAAHIVRKKIKVGENILSSGIAADAAVYPEYRGQGVFTKIYAKQITMAKKDGIRCYSGTTSNPIMIKMMKTKVKPFPHKLVELIRVRDLIKHIRNSRNWRRLMDDVKQNLLTKLQNNIVTYQKDADIENIVTIKKFDDTIDLFWDEIKDNYNLIFVRNKTYLNWRYCDPRGGEYTVKMAQDGEKILGYIVLRVNRENKRYPEGYIVDLLVLPGRSDVLESLVITALNYFDDANVNVIQYWGIDKHPYSERLKEMGFVEVPFRLELRFHNPLISNEELDILKGSEIQQMHYCFGDHDMI